MSNSGALNKDNEFKDGYGNCYQVIEFPDEELDSIEPEGNPNTCFDYVDCAIYDPKSDRYGVVVFVEPCGNLIKFGESVDEVIHWWKGVFELQPKDMDYIEAGWHLAHISESPVLWGLAPSAVWSSGLRAGLRVANKINRVIYTLLHG